jgi:poly(A) polymerase
MTKQEAAFQVLNELTKHGHEAYFAGGCVRDRVRGVAPKDFDIATNARPEAVQKIFPKTIPVGVQFGVVLVMQHSHSVEVATFRTEGNYRDGRRPDAVEFATLAEDAKRRDFTVNGLYWDGKSEHCIDLVHGIADLNQRIIRCIGKPDERFGEDHLRMLRAVRFAVQLGFEIEPATFESIRKHAALIQKISPERIRDELAKLLTSPQPARGMRLLDESGLVQYILPEVLLMKGVEQPPQYHPEGDVYVHTMLLMEQLNEVELALAWGCLLHDIAKPNTFERAADRIRFHGHDRIGAEMTEKILRRLHYPNDLIRVVAALVAEHLKFKDTFKMKQSTLKRFFAMERFDLHLELHRIDCNASHKDFQAYEFCKKHYAEFLAQPPPVKLPISGEDLKLMGFPPGREYKTILTAVEDAILEGTLSTREEALAYVKTHFPPPKPKK